MKIQGHITHRTLPLQGQCAFVCTAAEGSHFGNPMISSTVNERHPIVSHRLVVSLGYEDWMHPGKGGA
ncbi:hypothetical protein [Caldimonas brevitalea]|uniref:Uncharacterized protein n=1 Tax=Caldimonas brevitalea TaxID=413882 RepID=A0A0G3BIV9_9BURK|nr:hypothetical protein [Caldimonas brevitalea]AKJ27291.1 hypothetical protein AAW51_0600 [Caldimonas brevitalea]